jgi:hypothetical protein
MICLIPGGSPGGPGEASQVFPGSPSGRQRSVFQNMSFGGVQAASSFMEIHRLRWGARPPTPNDGFPGGKGPLGPPQRKFGVDAKCSLNWVAARGPPTPGLGRGGGRHCCSGLGWFPFLLVWLSLGGGRSRVPEFLSFGFVSSGVHRCGRLVCAELYLWQ